MLSVSVNSSKDSICNNSCRVFWQSLSKSFQLPNNPRSYAGIFPAFDDVGNEKAKNNANEYFVRKLKK